MRAGQVYKTDESCMAIGVIVRANGWRAGPIARPARQWEGVMNTTDDLRRMLTTIYTELGNLSISSDGETRRRIAAAVIEARELIARLELESEECVCRCK